ncbi:MAG: PilZ domain-containing protein [Candidatus Acidiferrales bacterium]
MQDDGQKKNFQGSKYSNSASVKESERRGADRIQFTATAEVVELSSGARFSTRTTDLGPGGCFVDTTIPFPVGTKVRVRLVKGKSSFEADGAVVYSQSGLGMGISFEELNPERREALESWLGSVAGERLAVSDEHRVVRGSGNTLAPDRAMVIRLVHLLVEKRILTDADAASILHEPVL